MKTIIAILSLAVASLAFAGPWDQVERLQTDISSSFNLQQRSYSERNEDRYEAERQKQEIRDQQHQELIQQQFDNRRKLPY